MKILIDVMDKNGVTAAETQAKIRDILAANNILQSDFSKVTLNKHTGVFHVRKHYLPVV